MNEIEKINEIEIKRHSFETAKNRLKEFSEKGEIELRLEKVKEKWDFFGLEMGDNHVTGAQFNERLESIRENFITVNSSCSELIKEFREVYNVFDFLDKDYIASILANVKSVEKTSNDVRKHQVELEKNYRRIEQQQAKLEENKSKVNEILEEHILIVQALKNINEKLKSYKHLKNIDMMWDDLEDIKKSIGKINENIIANIENDSMNSNQLNSFSATISEHNDIIKSLTKKMKHSYWISGGAVGIAIIELILILSKVI